MTLLDVDSLTSSLFSEVKEDQSEKQLNVKPDADLDDELPDKPLGKEEVSEEDGGNEQVEEQIEEEIDGEKEESNSEESKEEPESNESEENEKSLLDSDKLKELQTQIDTLEERRRHTQQNWDKEKQERKSLEDKIRNLEDRIAKEELEKTKLSFESLKSKIAEGDENAIIDAFSSMQNTINKLSKDIESFQVNPLDIEEHALRIMYNDADEVLSTFSKYAKSDPKILEEWQSSGASGKKAYEIGKRLQEAQEIINNPASYKEKIIKEYEDSKTESQPKKTLSQVNSRKDNRVKQRKLTPEMSQLDMFDSVFAK